MAKKGNHNYQKKENVILEFNACWEHYKKYEELKEGNPVQAKSELNDAGSKLQISYENGLKNYLNRRYKEKYDSGILSWKEYNGLKNALETGKWYNISDHSYYTVDQKYLSDQMDIHADPPKNSTGINFNVIRNNLQTSNNRKHFLDDVEINKFEAAYIEIRKFILVYIDENAAIELIQSAQYEELLEECDFGNEYSNYNYCLICDKTNLTADQQCKLVYINWSLVIDFDIETNQTGLMKSYITEYGMEPNSFDILNPKNTIFNSMTTLPYWFHVNGLKDYSDSIPEDDRKWKQKYGSKLYDCFSNYKKIFSKPLKVIILNGNAKRISTIIEALDAVYDNQYRIYLLSKEVQFESIKSEPDYKDILKYLPLTDYEFAQGIANFASLFNRKKKNEKYYVYGKSGKVGIQLESYSCFDIPYLGVAEDCNDIEKDNVAFYQGRQPLSWYGAKYGFAVNRFEQYKDIKNKIINYSKETTSKIIRLYHGPGAGGTTLARMILYDLSKEMPVLLLSSYNDKITTVQLENFYQQVETSVLIVAESSIISEEDLKKLNGDLMAKAIPHVFLYVCRTRKDATNSLKLLQLIEDEFDDMKKKLEPFLDKRKEENIEKLRKNQKDRYPFFMSMYTFEEDFVGIKDYIKHFLDNISDVDYNRLAYISLVDKYANRSLDIGFFNGAFNEDYEIFQDNINANLIIKEKKGHNCFIKIRHPRFAEEIINMRIAPVTYETDMDKAENLSCLIKDFIKYSKQNIMYDLNSTMDVLKNLLILRDTEDSIIDKKFAPVIEELKKMIPITFGDNEKFNCIGLIFKELVNVYPYEPHFRAHLSRYYSILEKNYKRGIEEARVSVDLAERQGARDALLYHIYGMSIKRYVEQKLYQDARDCMLYDEKRSFDEVNSEIQENIELAGEQFRKVRESTNNKIAGYISDIEMCIKLVDFGKDVFECSTEDFVKNHKDSWYMHYYDKALTLMEGFRSIQVEEETEFYKVKLSAECLLSLNEMIDSIEKTIEMWEDYLQEATESQKPVVRRFIARAKTKLIKSDDEKINVQHVREILTLMENNIKQEPNNGANIRLWFNALRYSDDLAPEILLDEASEKLLRWKQIGDNYESHYYYFILTCIKAIEGNSIAEGAIPDLLEELKAKTAHMPNNHVVYEWLGKGSGIKRLINAYEIVGGKYRRRNIDIIEENGDYRNGRISSYKNDRHAEIRAEALNKVGVFFSPNGQEFKVTAADVNKSVQFILGFTYSGLRALNKSVHFIDYSAVRDDNPDNIQNGRLVKCRVIKSNSAGYYLKVQLMDFINCFGSIHKSELPQGKTISDYTLNEELWARVTGSNYVKQEDRLYYQLKIEEESEYQKKLKEIIL